MHRSEARDLSQCWSCGAEVAEVDRSYAFGADGMLCFACAGERGGVYDEVHDRWTTPPDVAGLEQPDA